MSGNSIDDMFNGKEECRWKSIAQAKGKYIRGLPCKKCNGYKSDCSHYTGNQIPDEMLASEPQYQSQSL